MFQNRSGLFKILTMDYWGECNGAAFFPLAGGGCFQLITNQLSVFFNR